MDFFFELQDFWVQHLQRTNKPDLSLLASPRLCRWCWTTCFLWLSAEKETVIFKLVWPTVKLKVGFNQTVSLMYPRDMIRIRKCLSTYPLSSWKFYCTIKLVKTSKATKQLSFVNSFTPRIHDIKKWKFCWPEIG